MLRQHYALLLQNRIVRLEMRVRYFQMSGKRFEPVEQKLNFNQIAALRFASDSELPALVDRALKENLSPDAIKKKHYKLAARSHAGIIRTFNFSKENYHECDD